MATERAEIYPKKFNLNLAIVQMIHVSIDLNLKSPLDKFQPI